MIPNQLTVGTNNQHKLQEIEPLLQGLDLVLKPASAFGPFDPVEDGTTVEENAIIKARAAMELSNQWAMADDTALEIDALGGEPGIYAARYAGENCSFQDNVQKVLTNMAGVADDKRKARFICAIALCRPNEEPLVFKGICEGKIINRSKGSEGFGYDPIFFIESLNKTLAELSPEEKNKISHRAIAVSLLKQQLENWQA